MASASTTKATPPRTGDDAPKPDSEALTAQTRRKPAVKTAADVTADVGRRMICGGLAGMIAKVCLRFPVECFLNTCQMYEFDFCVSFELFSLHRNC
jgi:hypothetical protein